MSKPPFRPGFRVSVMDSIVIVAGTVTAAIVARDSVEAALGIAFVVGNFSMFCNVFRISRPAELIWSAILITLAGATSQTESPGWPCTFGVSGIATVVVILLEVHKPSYHGVGWQRLNPNLRSWWDAQA